MPSRICLKIDPIQLMGQNRKASRSHDAQATWDLDMLSAAHLGFNVGAGENREANGIIACAMEAGKC